MNKYLIALLILGVYCFILVKILVFKDIPAIRFGEVRLHFGGTRTGPPNLVPFKSILPYLMLKRGLMNSVLNLAGNIVLLIPVGFLALVMNQLFDLKKAMLLAIASGFIIEGMQVILRVGIFDIDDVILNGLGVIVGYWIYRLITGISSLPESRSLAD